MWTLYKLILGELQNFTPGYFTDIATLFEQYGNFSAQKHICLTGLSDIIRLYHVYTYHHVSDNKSRVSAIKNQCSMCITFNRGCHFNTL